MPFTLLQDPESTIPKVIVVSPNDMLYKETIYAHKSDQVTEVCRPPRKGLQVSTQHKGCYHLVTAIGEDSVMNGVYIYYLMTSLNKNKSFLLDF